VHPFGDLSAYLDGALPPSAHASVQSHLDTCGLCRTRLEELRGTARLIAGLPMPVPSRSLVPRVSIPFWVAPLRTLSAVASGAAIFLFVASALLAGLPQTASSGAARAPNAQPAAGGAPAANAPTGQNRDASSPVPSPSGGFSAFAPTATPAASGQVTRSGQTGAPKELTRQDAGASAPALMTQQGDTRLPSAPADRSTFGPSPWVWLGLAVGFGALAILLGRRLRAP